MENLFSCLGVDRDEPQPWLLMPHPKNPHIHTFYSTSKQQYFEINIPEFHMKKVSPASDGWLFIIKQSSKQPQALDCYLLNPSAPQHRIQLPPIDTNHTCQCVLSKSPTETTADCRVLILTRKSIFYCRPGDELFMQEPRDNLRHLGDQATSLNGKIYSYTLTGHLFTFVEVDFVGQELVVRELRNDQGRPCQIEVGPSPHHSLYFSRDYIVEYSGNEFLLVHLICYPYCGSEVEYFRIFKVNVGERECEELMSIGDRAIFLTLSGNISLLCTEKSGLMRNSIYYVWYDKNVYVYDIEDRSKTFFRACNVAPQCNTESWIMI